MINEENSPHNVNANRKWLCLIGVLLTWIAIIVLIFVIHRSRNSGEQEDGREAEVAAAIAK